MSVLDIQWWMLLLPAVSWRSLRLFLQLPDHHLGDLMPPTGKKCEIGSCQLPATIEQPVGVYNAAADKMETETVAVCGAPHDLTLGINSNELPKRIHDRLPPPAPMEKDKERIPPHKPVGGEVKE
jgi:hypothetical protein